jgi:Response regulator containing a CheY-like receiver domain and an HTH DNA-binding domain
VIVNCGITKVGQMRARACEPDESSCLLCARGLAVYREAVGNGSLSAERAVECVVRLGLLRPAPGQDGRLVPVPPAGPLAQALRPHEESIAQSRTSIAAIQAAFASAEVAYSELSHPESAQLTLLTGPTAISAVLGRAVESCEEELITVQPGGGRAEGYLAEALPRDLGALARGVRQYTLYQHTVRTHRPTLEYIRRIVAAGGEVRTTCEVDERLIVCDRRVAFIPVDDQRSEAALMVRHPAVVRFLVRGFERLWERGIEMTEEPAPGRPPAMVSDLQKRMLHLLVGGHTDASMASRLGVSTRTVSEYIRKISQQLGSSSRAQLGYLIATSGLLDQGFPERDGEAL